jgi:hypothetical protein
MCAHHEMGPIVGGIAGNNAILILRIALGFRERLLTAIRAPVEVGVLRRHAIERANDALAGLGGQVPLPTVSSLRFQFPKSQISNLISGRMKPATRQNAGTVTGAAPPRPPGTLNGPAATSTAEVMVTSGRASFAKF